MHVCIHINFHASTLQVWKQFDKCVKEEVPATVEVIMAIFIFCYTI